MKNKSYKKLAIKVAVFYFIAGSFCQTIQAQADIRFRLVRDTFIVVSATVNQQGPFDFVLDTGADMSIVDPSLASKLSLESVGRVSQSTFVSTQNLTASRLESLAIGAAQAQNLNVLVQDLSIIRNLDPRIEGIAGQDFLSHFNYLIDYRKHSVRFEQENEIRGSLQGDALPIQVIGYRMIVSSDLQSSGRANLHFLIDSGANSIVLLPEASQALHVSIQENRVVTTSSGQAGIKVGRIRELKIGSQQFHDLAVALTATEPSARIGDGLLPTSLFKSIYVNNHEMFVVLNPQPKKNSQSPVNTGARSR